MKKIKITLENLFELKSAVIYNPDEFQASSHVTIDSRNVKKNSVFFAIKGDKFDGHAFVKGAVKKGASTLVINKKKLKDFDEINCTIVTVDDTIKAYGQLANIWRKKLNAKVVSITGSNGKTSTKEILSDMLTVKYKVVKSLANNNNHIGVPLTIFSANEKTQVVILEHGTNHFKEIEYTAKIAEPDFALITNIGSAHLEFLKNLKSVYKEKSALLTETIKSGGKIFINSDDPVIKENAKKFSSKITYGFKGKPRVKAKVSGVTDDGRSIVEVKGLTKKMKVEFPLLGISNAKNFLAAFVIAEQLGMTKKEILDGIKNVKQVNMRLEVHRHKNFMLIDDTYNSNPNSVETAVDVVAKVKTHKRKILILGDMFELGNKSEKLHRDLSKYIPAKKNLKVLLIGKYMLQLHKKLEKMKIDSTHFRQRKSLLNFINEMELNDSVIVVKGSRGMKMEEFVEAIENRTK